MQQTTENTATSTDGPLAAPMLARLRQTMQQHADRPALCIDDQYYTYRQLAHAVGTLRHALHPLPDRHVGLVANDDLHTYAAILALWMEGKSYVPLHPLQPLARCLDIIGQVDIQTVIDTSDNTRYTEQRVIRPDRLEPQPTGWAANGPTTDDQTAYILFTSGSTGRPKGVTITLGNVAVFADSLFALGIELGPDDRCLQMFDLTFDMSVGSYLTPLLCGACVYTVHPGRIKWQEVYRLMEQYAITEAQLVPSVIHYMRPYFDEIEALSMRYVLFAGEGLPADDVAAWQHCVPRAEVWNVYGPTENTVYSTGYLIPRNNMAAYNGIVGIGRAMRHVQVRVADAQGRPLPAGQPGELCLAGRQLTPGYWDNAEKNREAFFEADGQRWYRTGDICELQADGTLLYQGRRDSQVQIQGYRVELSEIEHVARTFYHEETGVAVVPMNNGSGDIALCLAVEGTDGQTDRPLMAHLRQYLPQYMLPTQILHLPQFPQNASNKIDRKEIQRLAIDHYHHNIPSWKEKKY